MARPRCRSIAATLETLSFDRDVTRIVAEVAATVPASVQLLLCLAEFEDVRLVGVPLGSAPLASRSGATFGAHADLRATSCRTSETAAAAVLAAGVPTLLHGPALEVPALGRIGKLAGCGAGHVWGRNPFHGQDVTEQDGETWHVMMGDRTAEQAQ